MLICGGGAVVALEGVSFGLVGLGAKEVDEGGCGGGGDVALAEDADGAFKVAHQVVVEGELEGFGGRLALVETTLMVGDEGGVEGGFLGSEAEGLVEEVTVVDAVYVGAVSNVFVGLVLTSIEGEEVVGEGA